MVVDKTVVRYCRRVVQIHVDQVVVDEAAGDERVWEVVDWHREVVKAKLLVDVQFTCGYLFQRRFSHLSEGSKSEFTIINISNGIEVTSIILFDFLELDVTVRQAANLFFKEHLVGIETINFDIVFSIIFLCNCNR